MKGSTRKEESIFLCPGWLALQMAAVTTAEPIQSLEPPPGRLRGCRGPRTCFIPLLLSKVKSRVLGQRWNSWDSNWHSECWCQRQRLGLLHHNADPNVIPVWPCTALQSQVSEEASHDMTTVLNKQNCVPRRHAGKGSSRLHGGIQLGLPM